MQIKKFVATGLSALMAGATMIGGAYAAGLADYPTTFDNAGNLDAVVVVGATAAASDVAGAIDVAANLANLNYKTVSTGGTGIAGFNGLEKNGISIGISSGGTDLSTGQNAFPTVSALKNSHYSGLWTGTVSFNSSTYNAHEEVDVSGVRMRHDLGTDKLNGTEKMVVNTNANIVARYKFDSDITGAGTIGSPQYTKDLKIQFLGKTFSIVGVGTSSIKMLSGTVGTATKDSTGKKGVTSGDYTVYVVAGSDGAWATLEIHDANDKVVDTISNARNGDTKTSTATKLDIKVTAATRVTGTDPATQHIEVDIVVGPTGATEYEYDGTADVSSSSKERFPGATDWYITFTAGSGAVAGTIKTGSTINVEYRPSDVQYLIAGKGVDLPNSYGALNFVGWNTDKFATVTIAPAGPVTAYNSTNQALTGSTLYGVSITADTNSVGSGALSSPNWYKSMYLLFNQSVTVASSRYIPVMVGFVNTDGKVQINDTLTTALPSNLVTGASSGATSTIVGGQAVTLNELGFRYLNITAADGATTPATRITNQTVVPFKLNYGGGGDTTFLLNFTADPASLAGVSGSPFVNATFVAPVNTGSVSGGSMVAAYNNRTLFVADTAQLSNDLIKLGETSSSAENQEINVTTEGTVTKAGTTQQEVVGDIGILLSNPNNYGGSDKVVFKVPSKVLQVDVAFGGTGGTTASTSGTVKQGVAITNSIAKLDTELTDADKKKSIVSVGGPAVNSLSAQLLGVPFPSYGKASTIAENTATIKSFPDFFTKGETVILVAGYTADNTRLGTSVLQQYATKLAGVTANAVTVTGTSVASAVITPVVPAPATTTGNKTG